MAPVVDRGTRQMIVSAPTVNGDNAPMIAKPPAVDRGNETRGRQSGVAYRIGHIRPRLGETAHRHEHPNDTKGRKGVGRTGAHKGAAGTGSGTSNLGPQTRPPARTPLNGRAPAPLAAQRPGTMRTLQPGVSLDLVIP
jgi:hypothetical protein